MYLLSSVSDINLQGDIYLILLPIDGCLLLEHRENVCDKKGFTTFYLYKAFIIGKKVNEIEAPPLCLLVVKIFLCYLSNDHIN